MKKLILLLTIIFVAHSCGIYKKVDTRKIPVNADERVKKNMEEGKGFRLMNQFNRDNNYDFASSNPLWRASLDTIDFMPLALANYSGGILATDWYSDSQESNQSIKITIRFLTNEVRSDALDVSVFYKKCKTITNCSIVEQDGNLSSELTKEILKKAAVYAKQMENKDFKPYEGPTSMDNRT